MENKVLAIVNGKEITSTDVEILIQTLGPQRAAQLKNEQGRTQVLHELINQNLFLADAIDNKIDETEMFKAELERMKDNILTQVNINQLLSNIKISEEEAQEYFEKNQARFNKPEEVTASHILVDSEDKIKDIHEKISKNEITFSDAAKELSKCPSKQNGGNLGSFTRGKMVPEFENAAFDMQVGEVSAPVKTQFGYHIIKLENKTEAAPTTYEENKEVVYKDLYRDKQKEVYLKKLDELKGKYTVEIKK